MKVLICASAQAAVDRTADILADRLRQMPDSVLGLATGATMDAVYAALVSRSQSEKLSFARAKTFNLDEYVGLDADHPNSYRRYMQAHLFDHVDIDPANVHVPDGAAPEPTVAAEDYERAIAAAGGIDLQLLGIGRNGHIGFNEPSSSLGSRTRVKTLDVSTLDANAALFAPGETPPRYAITAGIGTILDSRECVLLATGMSKAEAVARMIERPIGTYCPATALQLHRRVTVVLDPDAASRLELHDYFLRVHPDGRDAPLEPMGAG